MTFGGISTLSLGGVGPSLCRHDPGSCHCLVCAEGICVSAGPQNTKALPPPYPLVSASLAARLSVQYRLTFYKPVMINFFSYIGLDTLKYMSN